MPYAVVHWFGSPSLSMLPMFPVHAPSLSPIPAAWVHHMCELRGFPAQTCVAAGLSNHLEACTALVQVHIGATCTLLVATLHMPEAYWLLAVLQSRMRMSHVGCTSKMCPANRALHSVPDLGVIGQHTCA